MNVNSDAELKTPKKIHYIWLGGSEKPALVKQCIESWKRFCPDFEIIEWDDKKFAKICDNNYALEAYAKKKWAFAADWLRLKVLYEQGGFYLDTDVEVLKPIDEFLHNELTMSTELISDRLALNTAFIGCSAKNVFIGEFLHLYDGIPFVLKNGEYDLTPNTARLKVFLEEKRNLKLPKWDETMCIGPGMFIYPATWFQMSSTGYALHHFSASWLEGWKRKICFSLGRYKLVRFKRRLEVDSISPELHSGEEVVFSLKLGCRKRILLIKQI